MKAPSCVYCGFPTRHWSQTCPAHRDLVLRDVLRLAEPYPDDLESDADADRPLPPGR